MDVLEPLTFALGSRPVDWFIVCGSGVADGLVTALFPTGPDVATGLVDLGLPAPSVQGHGNQVIWGQVGDVPVCVQTGRLHPYEGHNLDVCTAVLDAMLRRGVGRAVVLTCAAGALQPGYRVGELVAIRDQINLFGPTPLHGARFLDLSTLYSPRLRATLRAICESAGEPPLSEGVYAHTRGPQYETPAETHALRILGGDLVGMSTTYEAILTASYGVELAALAVVTNAAGETGLDHHEVKAEAARASTRIATLLRELTKRAHETGPHLPAP